LLVVLLRGDIYNVGSSRDPLRLGHRPVSDDVATGRAVLVMDRLALRVNIGAQSTAQRCAFSRADRKIGARLIACPAFFVALFLSTGVGVTSTIVADVL
jgi:hypothetical protein